MALANKPPMNDSRRETGQGTLTQRTFRSAAWLGGTSVVRLGLKLISVAILARLLTPQDYGVVAAALVVTQLAAMLYGLGFGPVLVQRKTLGRDHVATALGVSLAIAVAAGAALWAAAPFIAALMGIEALSSVVRWLALLTPFGAFRLICEALLARNMRGREVALQPLISFTISAFLVAIPLAFAGFGYWALVAMQAADIVIGAAALGIAARGFLVRPGFSAQAFRELWPMNLGFSLNKPFVYLGANADKLLIAPLLGAGALGLYSRASFLSTNTANLFGYIVRVAAFPAMAQVQDDKERLRSGLLKALSLTAIATIPVSAFCVVFAKPIIDLLLGPQWSAAVIPFAILSATLYLRLGRKGCGALFQALGRPYWLMGVQALNAGAVILAVLVGAQYGLNVVCGLIGSAALMTFLALAGMACKAADLKLSAFLNLHAAPLAISAVIVTVGAGTNYILAGAPSLVIVTVGFCTIAAVILALVCFKPQWIPGGWEDHAAHGLRDVIYPRLQRRPL